MQNKYYAILGKILKEGKNQTSPMLAPGSGDQATEVTRPNS